jgi:hypothetical protein
LDTKLDKAAAKIDSDKEKRALQKAEANGVEASYAASTRRHHSRQREENRALWQEFYERQYRAHARLASDYAAKAAALQDAEEGSHGG